MNALLVALLVAQVADAPVVDGRVDVSLNARTYLAGEVVPVNSVCMPDDLAVKTGKRIAACEAENASLKTAPDSWATSTLLLVAGVFLLGGVALGFGIDRATK